MADCIGHPSGWLVSLRPVRLTLYSLPPVLALLVVGLKTNLNEVIMANIATVAPIATEQNLIPVFNTTIGNIVQQAVDARVLHDFMQIKRDFTNWIKARIAKYGFVENQDFEVFANSGENSHLGQNIDSPNLANQKGRGGDRRSIDYHLTLDMAKELSMVENNDKGREARRYFIECERKAHEAAIPFCPHKDIQDELYRVSGGKRTVMVEISRLLRDRFGVARYFDIPVHQCKAAVEYVRSFKVEAQPVALSPQSQQLPLLPMPVQEGRYLVVCNQDGTTIHNAADYEFVKKDVLRMLRDWQAYSESVLKFYLNSVKDIPQIQQRNTDQDLPVITKFTRSI